MVVPEERNAFSSLNRTIDHEDLTTVEAFRSWVIHLEEINFSPNTIEAYARHVGRLLVYLSGNDKSLSDISIRTYDSFLQWLPVHQASEHHPEKLVLIKQPNSLRLSASLKNQVHLAVKSFYSYCGGFPDIFVGNATSTRYHSVDQINQFLAHIEHRKSTKNKDLYLSGDLTRARKKIIEKRLKPDQVLTLIKSCCLLRDAFLVTLLYNTGMRIGEALGLRHTDIDLSERVIWIIPRHDNQNGARAKSKRTRGIPVLDYIINMYEDYMTSTEYESAFETGTEYVFCNVQRGVVGKALSRSYAENLKIYLQKRANIQFSWHQFRHTHASEAIADGYSLLEVADRLGHASPQTTLDFYKHLFSSEVRKLHLTGPEKLKQRLDEYRSTNSLSMGAIKWI